MEEKMENDWQKKLGKLEKEVKLEKELEKLKGKCEKMESCFVLNFHLF